MTRSTTLGWIDGADSEQRLEVTLVQKNAGLLEFVMSEQHFAEGIGWFTQRSMSLDADQVAQLKRMLQVHEMPREGRPATIDSPTTLKLHIRSGVDDQPLADVG